MSKNNLIVDAVIDKLKEGFHPRWDRKRKTTSWNRKDPRSIIILSSETLKIAEQILKHEKTHFEITLDEDFEKVLTHLQDIHIKPDTWVDKHVADLYRLLHKYGFAHTVEARREGNLVGGLVGIQLGRAFIADTLYSIVPGASKICLCQAVYDQIQRKSLFIDVQVTHHLGEQKVPLSAYVKMLQDAIESGSHILDTRSDRKFPDTRKAWAISPAYVSGNSKRQTLEIHGFQVMQSWEMPLMKAMADTASARKGTVLEVGYGLGICAQFVQKWEPNAHVIIEPNREVAGRARKRFAAKIAQGKVHIYEKFWEEVVNSDLRKAHAPTGFDGIIFDTYPLKADEIRRNHFLFFPTANEMLSKNGVFTYFSDEPVYLSEEHLSQIYRVFNNPTIKTEIVHLKPWDDCEYWYWPTIVHVAISRDD